MTGRTSTEVDPKIKAIMAGAVEGAEKGTGALRGTYRVDVELLDGVATEARARGFRLIVDEPPSFGGEDAGPNPEEVLLAGVGTCQAITAALYAALLGIPIRRYSVRLIGDADFTGFYGLADDPPKGFDRVRCEVIIEADAPEEQLREFERMVEDRCVGHGTLRNPVAVEAVWKITGADSNGGAS
jgi:putative redox protein